MNPNVLLLDSTRSALVYLFQSFFPRKLVWVVCYGFVQITSSLSLYLCLIYDLNKAMVYFSELHSLWPF